MLIVYCSTFEVYYSVFIVYCPMSNVNVQGVLMTLYVIDHMK